jgi:hypothetical protein
MKNKEYRKAYDELAPEFALARALIRARVTAGFTQQQLAQRMDATQSRHRQAGERADPAISGPHTR